MTDYQPINCAYHDLLLHYATRKEEVLLEYAIDNEIYTAKALIKDVFTRNKEEFVLLGDGTQIRLDRIQKLNDTPFQGYC
jgi:Rho-binding antiterminator